MKHFYTFVCADFKAVHRHEQEETIDKQEKTALLQLDASIHTIYLLWLLIRVSRDNPIIVSIIIDQMETGEHLTVIQHFPQ